MKISRIHHAAYRCKDAKETVEWYAKNLNMDFVLAIAEDLVPSTKAPDPYMHIFLDAGGGNVLAFFELPTKPPMGKDPNTPAWVQHLAFEVEDEAALQAAKAHLEAPLYRRTRRGTFTLGGREYDYFLHGYNGTWRNERMVEVPPALVTLSMKTRVRAGWPVTTAQTIAVTPAVAASPGLTHRSKSAGSSRGKVRHRLVRSPFGSIASTGRPSMAASSMRAMPRPVLPLPVMPMQTAWVVRSRES